MTLNTAIPYGDIELDKIPGAWVLTHWLSDDIALRLKVRHTTSQEPDDCVAEVRLRGDEDFQVVHEFRVAVYSVLHPEDDPTVWDDLPLVWTRQFLAMVQVWAHVNEVTELGASVKERYAGEPHSSRDHFLPRDPDSKDGRTH